MQKYSAQSQATVGGQFFSNLYANNVISKTYYFQLGAAEGSINPAFGLSVKLFRASDSGTSGTTTNGQLLGASGDSLSANSVTQLKTGFSINPTVGSVPIVILPVFFRSMVEWTAKRGRELTIMGTNGLAAYANQNGAVTPASFSMCYQFEE